MFVCCECCMLPGRGLCDELITHPEVSYRLWCVVVCDLETSRMRRSWPAQGRNVTAKKINILGSLYVFFNFFYCNWYYIKFEERLSIFTLLKRALGIFYVKTQKLKCKHFIGLTRCFVACVCVCETFFSSPEGRMKTSRHAQWWIFGPKKKAVREYW
jgi:hypothetical protein